jgi:integral membrane protein (TIGR01906 family)
VNPSIAQRLASVVAVVATPCVVIAVAVILFLNPIWVAFDQGRSDVSGLTGYTPAQVQAVTGSILSDLVFGPPNFAVPLAPGGQPILDERERSHMADVRTVILDLGLAALIAAVLLVGVCVAARGRRWFWRSVALGGRILAVGVVVVGVAFGLFFDQAFETFHEIFFPPGTYMFDPTEKLVQLFPDQFWSETSIAISVAILILAVVTTVNATRLGRGPEPEPETGARAGAWAP